MNGVYCAIFHGETENVVYFTDRNFTSFSKKSIRYVVGSAMFKVVHSMASIQHREIGATYSEMFGKFEVQYMPIVLNFKRTPVFGRISFLSTREEYLVTEQWKINNEHSDDNSTFGAHKIHPLCTFTNESTIFFAIFTCIVSLSRFYAAFTVCAFF